MGFRLDNSVYWIISHVVELQVKVKSQSYVTTDGFVGQSVLA
jgi:hypothetical protein